MLAIVVSRADTASAHIGEHLLELVDWTEREDESRPDGEGGGTVYRTDGAELREFDALHLELADAAAAFDDPDLLVFASRHAGDTGPLLTAHHTGNLGPAEYGGADRSLARACPHAHRRALAALDDHAPEDYDVGMECTHHGPTSVGVPSMFVEVGSAEEQWQDPAAAHAVASAILDLEGVAPDAPPEDGTRRHLVGLGGGHYAPRFERVIRETDWAVGHVAADWGLDELGDPRENRAVVDALFTESAASRALFEGDHPDLEAAIADLGYDVVGETWVRETVGVDLSLVERLEAALGTVDAGLRLGEPATDCEGDCEFHVVSLPDELLAEAQGIDAEAAREAVERHAIAFETDQNGTRAAGRAAVLDRESYDRLVDGLAAALQERYDVVEREGDAVHVSERAFDPEKAHTLGVPEGPKFGRLSAGEPVDVDGETIPPEAVRVERDRTFAVPAFDDEFGDES
jgi:D-aminoacyl-tRNA deacylase